MTIMAGHLTMPPERVALLGKPAWKNRYVVLGSGSHLQAQNEPQPSASNSKSASAKKSQKLTTNKPSVLDIHATEADGYYLTIYKAKGDAEYVAQYHLSAFQFCEIKTIAHRKQSPALPTLILQFRPDSLSEKQRKRRSSRTAGLSKDAWADTLLFRTVPEEQYSIYHWQIELEARLRTQDYQQSPLSPLSPASGIFTNPFATRDPRESRVPPGALSRHDLVSRTQSHTNTYPHAPRERPPGVISPSPSLRSRRSDLSSQASSLNPPLGFIASHPQTFPAGGPSDLPSPANSGYDHQFADGWNNSAGRSSAISSHTRASNSLSSAPLPPGPASATSPGPRETILDRAFQLRCIPGSERMQGNEEEKSSIARFEALMLEADRRKLQESLKSPVDVGRPGWELDEESEESDMEDPLGPRHVQVAQYERNVRIPTPAQQALDYIAGRRTPLPLQRPISPRSPSSTEPPIPFLNRDPIPAYQNTDYSSTVSSGLRPRTGVITSTSSHAISHQRPTSIALPIRAKSTAGIPTLKEPSGSKLSLTLECEKRRSSTSQKRLSFTEFARRLSSTSSLLLVQTNASSNGREGSDWDEEDWLRERNNRTGLDENRDKSCGWRGGIGAFGEGGFL